MYLFMADIVTILLPMIYYRYYTTSIMWFLKLIIIISLVMQSGPGDFSFSLVKALVSSHIKLVSPSLLYNTSNELLDTFIYIPIIDVVNTLFR